MECVECGARWETTARTGRPRRYCSRSCQGRAYRRRRDQGGLSAAPRTVTVDQQSTTALEAAIAMADTEGVDAVTLRSIAVRSGVALTAVQRAFGSRDRLVAMMVQHILAARMEPPARSNDPVGTLTTLAEQEWRAYESHPWLVSVMASARPPLVPAVLDASRGAIDAFMALGLNDDTALNRYLALSAYIQGMGLLLITERRESVRSGTSHHAWWSEEIRRLDRTGTTLRHPWLTELAAQPGADGFDANACFHDGLHRVVSGLVHSGSDSADYSPPTSRTGGQ